MLICITSSSFFSSSGNSPFTLVHSNVWGPSPIVSKTSICYFLTFVDDFFLYDLDLFHEEPL